MEERAKLERKLAQKEKEKKEEVLRQLAQKARDERAGIRNADEEEVGGHILNYILKVPYFSSRILLLMADFFYASLD